MIKLNIIETVLQQRGISISQFSRHIGVSPQTIRRAIKNNSTSLVTLERIANGLGLGIEQFFKRPTEAFLRQIPHIPTSAQAGSLTSYTEGHTEEGCEKFAPIPGIERYDFTITIEGDSMLPQFTSGDIIACKFIHQQDVIKENTPYIIDSSEGVVIKHLHLNPKEGIMNCISTNPAYKPYSIDINAIYSIAKVVAVVKTN